ncbi:MAG: DVU0524 family FlgM-associated protein [Desulfomicrobiaceae bacterium]
MTISPFLVKNVLRTYDQQLDTGRRISRLKKFMSQRDAADSVSISQEAKRRLLVERVAREIVDNLVGSTSTNPVVQEIRQALDAEFGPGLVFRYPPDGDELEILRKDENGTPRAMTNGEKDRFMQRLWQITYHKVDATML